MQIFRELSEDGVLDGGAGLANRSRLEWRIGGEDDDTTLEKGPPLD